MEHFSTGAWLAAARSDSPPDDDGQWQDLRRGVWTDVTVAKVTPAPRKSLLVMNSIVDHWQNQDMNEYFTRFLRSSIVHELAYSVCSACTDLKEKFRVLRVLRVENWHLWQ